MPKKVRFRRAVGKDHTAECVALALMQPHEPIRDAKGNRLDLDDRYSIENIQKMTPSQRAELKAKWVVGPDAERLSRETKQLFR